MYFYISSALDDIIDQLGGPSNVAEMTGRKGRMVKDSTSGQGSKQRVKYEHRSGDSNDVDSLNVQEVRNKSIFFLLFW